MPMARPSRAGGSPRRRHPHRSRHCGVTRVPSIQANREDTATNFDNRIFKNGVLTLLLVLMGVALLYAYKAQSPSAAPVLYSQAVAEIQSGQVKRVTINGDTATLDKTDNNTHETVTIGTNDGGAFQKLIGDYNATQPATRQVELSLQK